MNGRARGCLNDVVERWGGAEERLGCCELSLDVDEINFCEVGGAIDEKGYVDEKLFARVDGITSLASACDCRNTEAGGSFASSLFSFSL